MSVSQLPYRVTKQDTTTFLRSADGLQIGEKLHTQIKLYSQNNPSLRTLGNAELVFPPDNPSDVFGSKPHVEMTQIGVVPKARGQGITKELTRISVLHADSLGCDGNVILTADTQFGTPAAAVHRGNLFEVSNDPETTLAIDQVRAQVKAKQLHKKHLFRFDKLPMHLPNSAKQFYREQKTQSEITPLPPKNAFSNALVKVLKKSK